MPKNLIELKIITEFQVLESWEDKYQYLIELGQKLKKPSPILKNPLNLVQGCSSKTWIKVEKTGNKLKIDAFSESSIVNGLLFILIKILSKKTCDEIKTYKPQFISKIGFDKHLSLNRLTGFDQIINTIHQFCRSFDL